MSEEDPISTVEPSYREYIADQQKKEAEAGRPVAAYDKYLPTYRPSSPGPPPVSTYTLPSNERGVYGELDDQAKHGPINWLPLFQEWDQISTGDDGFFLIDQPLEQDELDFVRAHGFEFQAKIGSGTYGSVWAVECNHKDIKGSYACKVIDLKEYNYKDLHEAVDYVLAECELSQSFNHDNLVRTAHIMHIHDQNTGFPMIRILMFMEACQGDIEGLMDSYQENKLGDAMAKDVMRQTCNGLKVLHDNNVVHFDIKPKNILYKQDQTNANMTYKLSDFGLSRRFDGSFMVSEPRGTHQYMDPSLQEEDEESDARKADIYSMGATLIAMLVGVNDIDGCKKQFDRSSTAMASVSKNWDRIADKLSDTWEISIGATNLIHKMTQKDWSQRPTIDEVLADPWITD